MTLQNKLDEAKKEASRVAVNVEFAISILQKAKSLAGKGIVKDEIVKAIKVLED